MDSTEQELAVAEKAHLEGRAEGWRAACEALAEWHDQQAKTSYALSESHKREGLKTLSRNTWERGSAHEASARECRRRAGE